MSEIIDVSFYNKLNKVLYDSYVCLYRTTKIKYYEQNHYSKSGRKIVGS